MLHAKTSKAEKEILVSEFAIHRADQLLQQIGFTPNHLKRIKWRTINTFLALIALFLPWVKFWDESFNGFQIFQASYIFLGELGNIESDSLLMFLLTVCVSIAIFLGLLSLFVYSIASLLVAYRMHHLLHTRFWNNSTLILFLVWFMGLAGILVFLIIEKEPIIPWGYWMIWFVITSSVILELKTLKSRRV